VVNELLAGHESCNFKKKNMPNVNKEELLKRITVDAKVLVGKPTIRGLRISVEQILEALAGGVTEKDILDDYPELQSEDIRAALLYANELVKEEKVFTIKQ
jgi:uncharacterized protein (DUF433 family)